MGDISILQNNKYNPEGDKLLPFALIRINRDGFFVFWENTMQDILQYSEEEVLNKKRIHELLVEPEELNTALNLCISNGHSEKYLRIKRKEGGEIDCLLKFFSDYSFSNELEGFSILFIETMQVKQISEELEQKKNSLKVTFDELLESYKYIGVINRRLSMLVDTFKNIILSDDFSKSVVYIVDYLKRITGGDIAFLRSMNEADNKLYLKAYKGDPDIRPSKYVPLEKSLLVKFGLKNSPLIIDDINQMNDLSLSFWKPHHLYKSMFIYPLILEEKVYGELVAYSKNINQFRDINLNVMELLAHLSILVIKTEN